MNLERALASPLNPQQPLPPPHPQSPPSLTPHRRSRSSPPYLLPPCFTPFTTLPRIHARASSREPRDALQLQMENVSKAYGDRLILDGISMHVTQGEVVGVLGPNGAGKSTCFNIMVGREKAGQGSVRFGDRDITSFSLQKRARLGIGYLPQEASVFRGLSVRHNILLILQETGYLREHRKQRLQELLEEFNLKHVESTLGKHLSGGERRRTELARALASNCSGGPPRILLVDEPFAGVDPIGVSEIQKQLRRLCKLNRMGILITDHNVSETLKICDRAYVVHNGVVMASGDPQEICSNPYVRQFYLGESFQNLF